MLLDDERPPQRDHHQDAEQAAQHRHDHDAADVHLEAEQHQGRHGDADAEGDRLAGRAGRLHDVVFEDGRPADAEQPCEKPRNSVIDSTATGIDADTVMPTLSTRYSDDAPKTMPSTAPTSTAGQVNSGICVTASGT